MSKDQTMPNDDVIDTAEELFLLHDGDKCPECKFDLESFKKFTAGDEFVWVGWCDKCVKDRVTIHGNNPKEPTHAK